MGIRTKLIALIILLLALAVACTGGSADESVEVAGPALVMFYTDN